MFNKELKIGCLLNTRAQYFHRIECKQTWMLLLKLINVHVNFSKIKQTVKKSIFKIFCNNITMIQTTTMIVLYFPGQYLEAYKNTPLA